MSGEICTDDRFEIIATYKQKLIERTNIQTSPDEMATIDNILFRFWQLGWLPKIPHGRLIDADTPITVREESEWGIPVNVKTTVSKFLLGHIIGEIPPTIIEAEVDND